MVPLSLGNIATPSCSLATAALYSVLNKRPSFLLFFYFKLEKRDWNWWFESFSRAKVIRGLRVMSSPTVK